MRCRLGERKTRRIERLFGFRVLAAFVRGGNVHFWASVLLHDGRTAWLNYRTGEVGSMEPGPWWGTSTSPHFLGEGI